MKKPLRFALKTLISLVLGIVALAFAFLLILWFQPEWILTSERVSRLAGVNLTLQVEKPTIRERRFELNLAPGCYSISEAIAPGVSFCAQRGLLAFTLRFHRTTILQLSALDRLDLRLTTVNVKPEPTPTQKEQRPPTGPPSWTRYLADRFAWGPLHLKIDELRMGDGETLLRAEFASANTLDSPAVRFSADAGDKKFRVSIRGEIEHRNNRIEMPEAKALYEELGPHPGRKAMRITSGLNGSYDLGKALLRLEFDASWKNPVPQFTFIDAEKGSFLMDEAGMTAKALLKLGLQGKTPLGALPVMELGLSAEIKKTDSEDPPPVDLKMILASYDFAGIHAVSDLELRMTPKKDRTDLELERGELRIEVPAFQKTVKALERTAWSIPAPFAVLEGPIVLKTSPFQNQKEGVAVPFLLTADLHSSEQALRLETRATLALAAKNLSPVGMKVAVLLGKIVLRIPDYDPIAPTPAFSHDPRIVKSAAKEAPPTRTAPGIPVEVTVEGPPASVSLLNRFLNPSLDLEPRLKFEGKTGVMTGEIHLSTRVDIEYLNRRIKLERMRMAFDPRFSFEALVSMERANYPITAEIRQSLGKTRIQLRSEPPLSDDEIVSLILYGMPRNSISSEQTRSVGSAQSAISSQALGVFSFWAFASTPIESVIYDPATQAYSAVIKLPGGIVASIGSNWEKDRQVSLSKSLGRNWAVSTELIEDSEGVDRGGTLLRWRKSY